MTPVSTHASSKSSSPFDGPLDLLLQLIEAEQLDITTISLSAVTDDYLHHVERLERQNLPEIAEWLVIAARLLLLKSRALLPVTEVAEEPADDLAAQLAEYKLFKELAAHLDGGLRNTAISIGKPPSNLELPSQLVTDGVDLRVLHEAFTGVLERLPVERPAAGPDVEPVISLEERIEAVKTQLAEGPRPFRELFTALRNRTSLIVTFLAILELFKQRIIAIVAEPSELRLHLRLT